MLPLLAYAGKAGKTASVNIALNPHAVSENALRENQ